MGVALQAFRDGTCIIRAFNLLGRSVPRRRVLEKGDGDNSSEPLDLASTPPPVGSLASTVPPVDTESSIMRNRDYEDHTVGLQRLETITRSSTLLAGG